MNPQLPNPQSQPDTLDRILLDDTLVPSSGFAASVMDSVAAINAQAAAPAPIPFPWKLALPGFAAFVVALIAAIRLILQIRHSSATFELHLTWSANWFANQTLINQITQALIALSGAFLCLLLTGYLAPGRSTR
jgi:hypothetical protein